MQRDAVLCNARLNNVPVIRSGILPFSIPCDQLCTLEHHDYFLASDPILISTIEVMVCTDPNIISQIIGLIFILGKTLCVPM
jgi:hypothetical protein